MTDGVAAARLWAASKFPYLASGVFAVVPVPAPGIGTVAVDDHWRLWLDPDVTAGWSAAQFGGVLVHHVCHLLREHAARASAAGVDSGTAEAWIRSADAEINDDLTGLELPGIPVLPGHLGAEPGQLAETYFAAAPAQAGQAGWDLDCGSGADGLGRPWEGAARPGMQPWQARLLRRLVAQETVRHGREAGDVPAGMLRWAEFTLEPVVDWRRALRAELRKAVADTCGAVDYSYRRPSRRATVTAPVVLPALRRPVPHVAVVCDTSGSMTEELLAAALAEVDGLLRTLGLRLRVIACDAAAAAAQRVSSVRQVELTGGGGTDMGEGIAAASALRPRPELTVVLTDGYTPWPDSRPKGMAVVIGLLGEGAPEGPAWARSIRIG